jgi:hypothetical protein
MASRSSPRSQADGVQDAKMGQRDLVRARSTLAWLLHLQATFPVMRARTPYSGPACGAASSRRW